MPVHWSSTYVMLDQAKKKKHLVDTFVYELGKKETNLMKWAKIDALKLEPDEWEHVKLFVNLLVILMSFKKIGSGKLANILQELSSNEGDSDNMSIVQWWGADVVEALQILHFMFQWDLIFHKPAPTSVLEAELEMELIGEGGDVLL
ncbi:hypothetical protein BDR06DRAFT_976901 [Suillus hirtellus]|nr:hypothetical protein BDR06DRAFT_976901 [Suillus hirtellus]